MNSSLAKLIFIQERKTQSAEVVLLSFEISTAVDIQIKSRGDTQATRTTYPIYSMSCSIHLNFEMTKEANGLVVNVIHDATIFGTQLFQACERDRSNEYYMSINHHRPCDDHRQIHVPFIYHIRVVSDVRVLRLDRL